ncbi:LIM and calponin homology domains-containing protein 1a isoform X4 [Nerophis lumbriciformis]|uniref:LIM and calponin homology domains-containing protein 1a isoform X4 n=1 Tax=Nerophis lumbriciformis TaxID=546530 RepID=UPI002AE0A55F|nr:LIM and calponin homology domains-containing protein 1-like isoform X4 [Nerophis lumbriciformis]
MASQAADRDVRPGCVESTSHPEPACREAQKWIEAVTGKSFGDKDFRSALENGILLCELLSAIRPGLVKKINRLPTPIAGLDNLSVFLRGCEQLGLKGSQLFDPGDLQDTSIRANLKDSDCSRKLKNVLNTMFWLGKAARGCASYSGPTLNLKEFEGLLAQMKMDSEESADGSQKRSVRDSGYDCWDSERSESLSPPRHTRDNSLDSLDSFGSRSQHSPSPDVANRSNTDGRASDLEADAAGRKPDVQKDDMSARRSASGESRSSIPFNQFLPNRSNASSYVLNPRRKSHVEDGEQRSLTDGGPPCETTSNLSPGAPEAPRSPAELDACLEKRMEEEQEEEEEEDEEERTPDVRKDDMMARRTGVFHKQSASAASYNHFLPLPASKRCPGGEVGSAEVDWMKNGNVRVSRRVALMSEDAESVSLSDIVNEDEAGHLPHPLSASRHERMHEQYNSFQEEDDQWRSDLARWKTRRRCTSQELIKKEEERKRMERMKEEGGDCNKRKSIKTYKEIVEDKERREAELCEAYRNAATPEEAAMVLQRYALRFTISDATLDYLKLPRSTSDPEEALHQAPHTQEAVNEMLEEPASTEEESMKCEEIKTVTLDTFSNPLTPTGTLHSPENTSKEFNQRPIQTRPEQLIPVDAPSQSRINPPEVTQVQPPTVKPVLTIPSPSSAPSRPVPLLAAKPYCQPRRSHGVKMDGLVRINGDSPTPPSQKKDLLANEASSLDPESVPEMPDKSPTPLQASSSSSSSSSFSSSSSTISSLFSGRNCITKTTIVTELTQTVVEPHQLEVDDQVNNTTTLEKAEGEQPARSPSLSLSSTISIPEYSPTVTEGLEESSVSIETPMLNLAKRVNHWVWDPNEERKRVERWQQEQERLLQEQYQKEQEKLKKEWEKAQLEVREQERKHNEEERRILEETVAPLSPGVLVQQQLVHPGTASPASHDNDDASRNLIHQQNGQKEDQHVSKLHFLQDSSHDSDPCKKQDMWKTTSLDRNIQPNLPQGVKRCDSHEGITAKQQQLPPSPTRCVSGKRLCSGCSQPLGKGAAMIIDTLGLFFHMQCFKCGLCEGQLGDATTGTDVRIRNGLLTCHDCYISSRGRGQPTTL